jgi:hypothetical protein
MSFRGWKSLPNKYRFVFILALLASGYFLPIYFFLVIAGIGIIIFDNFYEPVGFLFVVETIYGVPMESWSPFPFLATVVSLLVVLIIEEIKKVILIK